MGDREGTGQGVERWGDRGRGDRAVIGRLGGVDGSDRKGKMGGVKEREGGMK